VKNIKIKAIAGMIFVRCHVRQPRNRLVAIFFSAKLIRIMAALPLSYFFPIQAKMKSNIHRYWSSGAHLTLALSRASASALGR
jgi:hypothetical protein